ncbi:MAG: DUF6602 domain-containing protein [Mesonia hippocampi]|uniref:DUF6602 domain-containing protein n=1 Tax=Mesonia hippocampi TaxID=1628250 RepID=UPI003F9433C7
MLEQNAVVGSLLENLDQIKIVYKETYPPFQNDRGNTGDSKEYSIQEFIAAYLTGEYRIEKGCIYSTTENSQNIDCVILAPNHPILTTPKRKIILAEGVYAAVEVKPDIKNKDEFERALKQVKSIKKLERKTYVPDLSNLMGGSSRADFENKIPAIIFSAKSLAPEDLYKFIKEKILEGVTSIEELPDMILTLDNGLFVFAPDITRKPLGKFFIDSKPSFTKTTMIQFYETSKAETLALFLLQFLNLPSPIMKNQDFILNEYLKNIKDIKICGFEFGK